MRIRVLYHDHCFDGAASAAYFSRFMKDHFHPEADFAYTGMAHKASDIFSEDLFDGDVNAIVDFKYCATDKLTWWFDHHQSAFLSPEDEQHFLRDTSGTKFLDPQHKSCAGYIADIARTRFGHKIIGWMRHLSFEEIMQQPEIQELYQPLYDKHLRSVDLIRSRASVEGGVVYFDIAGEDVVAYNKFIPYHLFPEAVYTVSVSTPLHRTKVSVGSNPWALQPITHNLATICERYGGGGHPRVGAISFEPGAVEEARAAAREVVATLQSPGSAVA
ncbi:MAG: phosphoesterase [Bryobacterales bacterium]|nr:phosphoesterase [Bryobacterales bacterium]